MILPCSGSLDCKWINMIGRVDHYSWITVASPSLGHPHLCGLSFLQNPRLWSLSGLPLRWKGRSGWPPWSWPRQKQSRCTLEDGNHYEEVKHCVADDGVWRGGRGRCRVCRRDLQAGAGDCWLDFCPLSWPANSQVNAIRGMAAKLENLQTCNDLIVKHGHALQVSDVLLQSCLACTWLIDIQKFQL